MDRVFSDEDGDADHMTTPTAQEITAFMAEKNLTQADVSVRLGVSRAAVSRWVSGERSMGAAWWACLRADVAGEWPPPDG